MTDALFRRLRARLVALACALVPLAAPAAVDESDLLPVDQAFVLTAEASAPDRIALRWRIADGYYLYRHRMSAQADAAFGAQPLQLPRGKAYKDEFFGDVETYRDSVVATLPGRAGASQVTLKVKYQGCADAGICYPPQTRTLTVSMPGATGGAPAAPAFGFGTPARTGASRVLLVPGAGARSDGLPLPPEQAFGFEAIAGDGNTLLLRFTPAPGYYLYRDRTSLRVSGAPGIAAGVPRWPEGRVYRDDYFGDMTVYFDQIDVPLPLRRSHADAAGIQLTATFQGCQTDGICYPPMTRTVSVALPAGRVTPSASGDAATAAPTGASPTRTPPAAAVVDARDLPAAPAPASPQPSATAAPGVPGDAAAAVPPPGDAGAEDSRLAAALSGPDRGWALASFLGFGLLLAFTPCVLPMIPILSGLIAGHGPGLGARRAFVLSLVYVLANALVFTAAGVVAGLVGANLQIAFQTPWVIALFAALFVALALSSFGLYRLQLPAALQNRLGMLSHRQHGGSLTGVAVMGALSALIVGPCVAPPLAAAVLYIGQTQDPVFGGAALFLLALGMGLPLLAFGVAAGRGLPTSGPWMVAVERAFGFVFLGLAVWMLSRVLPGALTLALWGALLVGAAVVCGAAANRTFVTHFGARALGWTAALMLGLTGAAQIVGALAGSHDPLQPLAGLAGGAPKRELGFRMIKSSADLDREIAAAQAAGRPLMLDFYADWCTSCKEMERDTFPAPAVHAALDGFTLLKADVTANDALDQALMQRLGIIGPPATLWFVDGRERRDLRLFGFEAADRFAQRAARAVDR